MSSKSKLFHRLKWLVWILLVVFVAVAAVYPVENQDVYIVVDTSGESQELAVDAEDIYSLEGITMEYVGISEKEIREIRFHRSLKSVAVDKLTSGEVESYLTIEGNEIVFNQTMMDKLKSLSSSALLERLVVALIGLCVALLLWILLNAAEEKFDPTNLDNHGPINEIGRFISDMKKYREYMVFAAKADLKAEVANSYLNRLWWILEPFFNMLVYVIVFGKVMGNNIQNYATFTFSALLMWNYFNHIITYAVKCVRNNRDIVTKIYVPKYVLLITNMVLNFIKLLFSLLVLVVMLAIFRVNIGFQILYIIPAYALMLIFSFGAGMILLHYGVFIDDLSYAVGILIQMLMFLTGIFFDAVTTYPAPLNSIMIALNPCTVFIDSMRNALLYRVVANVPILCIWVVLSLLISYIGIHIVFKNENGYVKVI